MISRLIPARYSATAGIGFDDAELESRLTWIWGSPRSGSTWLLQMLARPLEPDPEAQLGFRLPPKPAPAPFDCLPVDESFISNHLAPALGDPREVDGVWMPATLNNYLDSKPTYAFSREFAATWRPEARRFTLVRLNGVIRRAGEAGLPLARSPHVVIKETNGSHAADLVMSLLPASRMLLLIRDGRDVVDSLLDAYSPGGFLARAEGSAGSAGPEDRRKRLAWAARLWACNTDVTLRAMDSHPAELSRIVRYEDLREDPVRVLTELFAWIGLSRDPDRVARIAQGRSFANLPDDQKGPGKRARSGSSGSWRDNLSPDEQRSVAEVFGDRLARFGYED